MTLILHINSANPEKAKIRRAAEIIRRGGIVVFPTETVYGIGANAFDKNAASKIFSIKGRASDNPLIVHVSSAKMAEQLGKIPKEHLMTIKKIWPAPLTIVVKSKKRLPGVVTAGLDTVAIRMPQNKIALNLIEASGVPIAAPSANISERPSSTKASHARRYFYGKVDAIIYSEPSKFGIESTIIDLNKFKLLRPGAYIVEDIEKLFGKKLEVNKESLGLRDSRGRPASPGMKHRHYSPKTPMFLYVGDIKELKGIVSGLKGFTFIGSNESCKALKGVRVIPLGSKNNGRKIASNLFDALITLDSKNARFAICESFEPEGIGIAIMNRLRKASGNKHFKNRNELYTLIEGI